MKIPNRLLNNDYLPYFNKNPKRLFLLSLLLVVFFPIVVDNNYILHILIVAGIYLILAVSLNIVTGLTGELDLGHAAFFGIGAYTFSLFVIKVYNNFWLGLIIAATVSLLFGILLGIPSLRIKGDYLAIVTLGFSEIVRYVLLNWQNVTNGPMGIHKIPLPTLFGYKLDTKLALFYLIFIIVIITIVLIQRLSRSRFGRALVAIRENEIAAIAMGINASYYKVWSFAISAVFAGIAGSLFACYMSYINPMNFTSNVSILILCMVVLGGQGSILGSVLGALVLMLLPEFLRFLSMYRMLLYGIVLITMMIFKPNGMLPEKRIPVRRAGRYSTAGISQSNNKDSRLLKRDDTVELLSIINICKYFSGLKAVDDVSFMVNKGETVSIIGPNGAGKTTLFNIISGYYNPTKGKKIFNSQDITNMPAYKVAEIGIARTFQNIRLFSNLTVIENVMISFHTKLKSTVIHSLLDSPKTQKEELWCYDAAVELLKKVNLDNKYIEIAKNLSYGEQKRLEIARALASSPELLLLDEPTAGMTAQEAMELVKFINSLKSSGITVILIEHNMRVVMDISDKIVVLDHGVKIAEGKAHDIQSDERVIEAYLGRREKHA